MSSQKTKVDVGAVYMNIMKTVESNRLRGRETTKKKVAQIGLGNGYKLGNKAAEDVMQKYEKYIKF